VGGIRHQITDGENGYLVDSVEEAATRMVDLIQHPEHGKRMGERARETVRKRFLLTHLLEDYLDLFGAFETQYHLVD
jgi:trehalose synthase